MSIPCSIVKNKIENNECLMQINKNKQTKCALDVISCFGNKLFNYSLYKYSHIKARILSLNFSLKENSLADFVENEAKNTKKKSERTGYVNRHECIQA